MRNNGVMYAVTKMLAAVLNMVFIIERTVKGITKSILVMSPEKRLIMRPHGVWHKNRYEAFSTPEHRDWWIRREARRPPYAIVKEHNISRIPTIDMWLMKAAHRLRYLQKLLVNEAANWTERTQETTNRP